MSGRPVPVGFEVATALTEAELLALFDRGAGIDRLVERLIDILDQADATHEDLEPEFDDDPDQDREDGGDDELSLGAPERSPSRPWFAEYHRMYDGRQTHWAAGNNNPVRDEGEAEAGYDLPEGDEELDNPQEDEASLGAPENHDEHPDQEQWAQGGSSDSERADEEPQVEPRFPYEDRLADKKVAREARRQAEAIRRRKRGAVPRRDPDELFPTEIDGVLIMGVVR